MGRAMKDSGIEWIGEIPSDWEVSPIKRNFKIVSGATPKSEISEYWDGDIIWITPADYKTEDKYVSFGRRNISKLGLDSCGTTIIPIGSIIFSKRAPVGSVAINTEELCTNQGCLSCIPEGNTIADYFYYLMSIATEQFDLFSVGTTFKEISLNSFSNFVLPYPPKKEQKIISNYLDTKCTTIDAVIEQTRSSIEEYKRLKQSVITQAVTKGIRSDRTMKDSGIEWIEQIPETWSTSRIEFVAWLRARLGWKGLKADEYVEDGYPFLSAFNIQNNRLIWDDLNYINKERYDESPEIMLHEGDILLVKDGAGIGKCARIDSLPFGESTTNGSLAVITPYSDLDYRYLFYYFLSGSFQNYIARLRNGMGVPHLSQEELRKIVIPVPSKNEQLEIVNYLDDKCSSIDNIIAKKENLIGELESYKKSMIYEYVTGKKEVPA